MRICIPSEYDRGLESLPYSHFGSAPYFIVYDTDTKKIKAIPNGDEHHTHGACNPLNALAGNTVDAIIVGGIGSRAIAGLNSMGIKVYQSIPGTIQENIHRLENHGLPELTPAQACSHHGHECKSGT